MASERRRQHVDVHPMLDDMLRRHGFRNLRQLENHLQVGANTLYSLNDRLNNGTALRQLDLHIKLASEDGLTLDEWTHRMREVV